MDNGIGSLSCVGDAGHIREVASNGREARAIELGRARLRAGGPDDFVAPPFRRRATAPPINPVSRRRGRGCWPITGMTLSMK